jgi:hypothetical protein
MKHLSAFVLLAAGFLGTVAVTPASAQVARDGNFYEEVKFANCGTTTACQLEFSATPQLILFSKVSCLMFVASSAMYAAILEIRDVSGGATRRREALQFPAPVAVGTTNNYSFVIPTDFMVSASKFPVIEIFQTGASAPYLECKITGRLQ